MYEEIKEVYSKKLFSNPVLVEEDDFQLFYIKKYLLSNRSVYVLDAGCGNGKYSRYLTSMSYENVIATDLFDRIDSNGFDYLQSSIDKLPFKDGSFDFVFSNSVIYYLDNPESGFRELKRVLKKNGVLIFSSHTKYSFFTLWRIFKRDVLRSKKMIHLQGVKFYSANYYSKIIQDNNCSIIHQDGFSPSIFMPKLYKKFRRVMFTMFNVSLPNIKPYSNRGILSIIKSEMAYHSIFVITKSNI